ncbi:uncharacterized protein [Rutidosis leptorrhynchoides]|uniref:uncharacterized protein n=1 Tax=Rutidosis leptorrhynchoides TaxID=125765 RepID=UPI003A99C41D
MTIDFKDINKACPKYNNPLPEIDWKVKSLHEYPFKCFLDAYKGYHQIPMVEEGEDKTVFHTDGEILYLYVSIANEAFRSVLVAEREKKQKPIYFVSKAITGSEINYAPMENFVYALLLISRRLWWYFQGHPIHVLTNLSVKQVLNKREMSGRLTKWAIELGSYEITYLPRTSMKGRVLADYLADMTGELEVIHEITEMMPAELKLGIYLLMAEYDALLAGLNIAHKMQITKLRAFVDSQLIANQFNGSFDAHELSMQKYLHLLKEAAEKFEHFELATFQGAKIKKLTH